MALGLDVPHLAAQVTRLAFRGAVHLHVVERAAAIALLANASTGPSWWKISVTEKSTSMAGRVFGEQSTDSWAWKSPCPQALRSLKTRATIASGEYGVTTSNRQSRLAAVGKGIAARQKGQKG